MKTNKIVLGASLVLALSSAANGQTVINITGATAFRTALSEVWDEPQARRFTIFVFVSMRVTSPDMKMLYTDLTTEATSGVAAKLEELQIRYQVSADGARVMVPANDVGRARMLLAQEGLPNGGSLGYEIFDSG